MSKYTQSIYSILQANMTDTEDLSNLSDLYNIAKRTLFGDEINVIDEKYRQQLITCFALHYFEFEIGRETFPLWQMALKARVMENGSYINQIFGLMDKNLFADYHVSKSNNKGSSTTDTTNDKTGKTTTTGEISNTTDVDGTTTDKGTNLTTNDLSAVTTGTGSITNAKTGNDTVTGTGTVTNAKSGTNTTTDDGSDKMAHKGTDKTDHTGTITDAITGTDETTKSGSEESKTVYNTTDTDSVTVGHAFHTKHLADMKYKENGSYTDTHDDTTHNSNNSNTVAVQNDTPMGHLGNMRTPNTSASGTGISGVDGYTYTYASAIATGDGTVTDDGRSSGTNVRTYNDYYKHDDGSTEDMTVDGTTANYDETNGTHTKTGNDTNTLGFTDRKDTTTHESNDTTTFNDSFTKTLNLTDEGTHKNTNTVEFGETNTQTNNTTDKTTFDETNTQTNDTTDTTVNTGTVNVDNSNTSTRKDKTVASGTSKNITDVTDKTVGNVTGTTNDESESEDYSLNYEMIMMSETYMKKVYECFDDLFLWIF